VLKVHSLIPTVALLALAGVSSALAQSKEPYTQATLTRLQNKVSFGDAAGRPRRPAETGDVIKASTYLLTETDSRAELKYPDGSIVRIGQNTVFTFEADTRTLSLEHGSLVFYIPKGHGGGTIRTGSLTASITGTIGKVADNMIAVLEGEVTLVPSGQKVPAGYFARRNPDGSITVAPFDPTAALGGKLMDFGGRLADFDERNLVPQGPDSGKIVRDIMDQLERPDRMQNHPGAQELYNPKDNGGKKDKGDDDEKKATPFAATPRRFTPPPTSTVSASGIPRFNRAR